MQTNPPTASARCWPAAAKPRRRGGRVRRGVSLVEAVLSLTLIAAMLVPAAGIMRTNAVLWRRFSVQHRQGNDQSTVLTYVQEMLRTAVRLDRVAAGSLQYTDASGAAMAIRQAGNQLYLDSPQGSMLIAEGAGTLSFTLVSSDAQQRIGSVVRVGLRSSTDAASGYRETLVRIASPI
jgi:hypothetical protein